MIKKWVGFVISWVLYAMGDLVSSAMQHDRFEWLYPLYNKLMCGSVVVQSWSNCNGPWVESKGDEGI